MVMDAMETETGEAYLDYNPIVIWSCGVIAHNDDCDVLLRDRDVTVEYDRVARVSGGVV